MPTELLITMILVFVVAAMIYRARSASERPAWAASVQGSRWPFVVIAVVATMLMMLIPEVAALGLFADAAFFDIMVFALSLQMHQFAIRACRGLMTGLVRLLRLFQVPGLELRYLLMVELTVSRNRLAAICELARRTFQRSRPALFAI